MGYKAHKKPALKYFSPSEFGVWYPLMNDKLLLGLDELRRQWGNPIIISPAIGAIGRDGEGTSWHFPRGGVVHAVDIMPLIATESGTRGATQQELQNAYTIARNMSVFSGIGVYPDWKPHKGLHIDTRTDRTPENPALWGGIRDANGRQVYISLTQALYG